MMRRLFQILLLLAASLVSARGHMVTQIFAEWKEPPGSWEMDVLFEAGYAEPDIRDDPAASAPDREWLMAQGEVRWNALRKEAEHYFRDCLEVRTGNDPVEWTLDFPDFQKQPPDFPQELNDGAYMRMIVRPKSPPEGPVTLIWRGGEPPTLILKMPATEAGFLTFDAGDRHEIKISGAPTAQSRGKLRTSFFQGYHHVIPEGWDHVLFVLGLFFYRRKWKPLLNQSLAFTAAHTVTLGLAAAGIVKISGNWVEPLIALSLVAIALENLRAEKETDGQLRLMVVFGFGLIHGLGFAGALSTWLKPGEGFLPSLLSANLGVEAAQATLLAGAWILTLRWNRSKSYRVVRLAACLGIAGTGTYWALQRIGWI